MNDYKGVQFDVLGKIEVRCAACLTQTMDNCKTCREIDDLVKRFAQLRATRSEYLAKLTEMLYTKRAAIVGVK